MFRTKKDEKLRLDLVKQAGFTLDEVPLVYAFIKGADEALSELQELENVQRKAKGWIQSLGFLYKQ